MFLERVSALPVFLISVCLSESQMLLASMLPTLVAQGSSVSGLGATVAESGGHGGKSNLGVRRTTFAIFEYRRFGFLRITYGRQVF